MWPVEIEVDDNYLDSVWAGYEYTLLAKNIVRRCKYDAVVDVARLMADLCLRVINFPPADFLCPVPLHHKRQKERGFNQAYELATGISQYINLPVLNLLMKVVHTSSQAKSTSQAERLNKLAGHFAINSDCRQADLKLPDSVILIDDVVTTGATLNECARVLKSAGVKKVYGVTFAHGL